MIVDVMGPPSVSPTGVIGCSELIVRTENANGVKVLGLYDKSCGRVSRKIWVENFIIVIGDVCVKRNWKWLENQFSVGK